MALTYAQAAKLSEDYVLRAIALEVTRQDDLFKMLPFARSPGRAHRYVREGAAIAAHFVDYGGAVAESAQTWNEVTANLRQITDDVDVPGFVMRNMSPEAGVASQIAAKVRALAGLLQNRIINGDYPVVTLGALLTGLTVTATAADLPANSPYLHAGTGTLRVEVAGAVKTLLFRAPGDTAFGTPSDDVAAFNGVKTLTSADGVQWIKVTVAFAGLPAADTEDSVAITSTSFEFDGLYKLADGNKVTGPTGNGDAISFTLLDSLLDALTVRDGQPVLIAPPRTIRSLKVLYAALGGMTAQMIALPQYGIDQPVLAYDGVPILKNRYMSVAENKGGTATCSSVYAATLSLPDGRMTEAPYTGSGLCGLYGGGTETRTVDGQTILGMFVEDVGWVQAADSRRYRVGGDFGLANYSQHGVARLYGITN